MPSLAAHPTTITVALLGNPNTGKSTLFGALAGVRQRVGNYPGVTVEKKLGTMRFHERRIQLIDLPGTYSLAPRSPDEMIAVDVLLGRRDDTPSVDVVLAIVDASNLERNLYLLSQVLELGRPTVVALNMVDVAQARGTMVDARKLAQRLGVPVVETEANRGRGLEALKQAIDAAAGTTRQAMPSPLPAAFQQEAASLHAQLAASASNGDARLPRYLVDRLLLDTSGYLDDLLAAHGSQQVPEQLRAARERLAASGHPVPAVEAISRYQWVAGVLDGVVARPASRRVTRSDMLDRLLTHRLWGTLVFVALMLAMFCSVFLAAVPLMDGIDGAIGAASDMVSSRMSEGALQSLVVDGIIGGVGSVLIFLPQILILFFFIAVLEDCGYMARAAYLMDKLMSRVGLSGKSFIPLLSSFACAIPGVMAARVIENRRDRLTTILVAPLMSCSARLPVYTILIAAFIPAHYVLGGMVPLQGLVLGAMYLLGIVAAAAVAFVLKRTMLRGPTPPFVMELPGYKVPALRVVLHRMIERGWSFVYRAGTLILAVAIVIWALSYYPHNPRVAEEPYRAELARVESAVAAFPSDDPRGKAAREEKADLENQIAAAYQRDSFLGRMGRAIEPAVRPLGWDWRIGCAAIASFPAREVVMSALGVIYNLGPEIDVGERGDQGRLEAKLREATWDSTGEPVYNIPVALSIMVFFALCAQCASTLAVIRRETNSWAWPLFTFTYMTTLAYLGAFATYQLGMWFVG